MAKFWAYVLLLGALLTGLPSCDRGAKVIPRSKFAEVYADLFMADVWMTQNPDERGKADTTRFYEYILNKRGYTTEDYLRSVEYYLDDPERYSKILKQASAILDRQERSVSRLVEAETSEEEMVSKRREYQPEFLLFSTLFEKDVLPDTICIKTDKYGRMLPEPVLPDSLWRGPGLTIARDTLKTVTEKQPAS